jgi:formate hydrogenlyase subunit 3/multisubunit Na+/H+ antiporter MnhD subunit
MNSLPEPPILLHKIYQMDIILMIIISLLLLTIAFIFINYKRALLRRKKTRQVEENKRTKVFEEALRLIDQYRLMDREI